MPGFVQLSYDATRNIVFTDDQWDIKTHDDVDGFFGEYAKFFVKIGKKFYMISNIDGLRVHADIADYYGARARETTERHLLGFARFGSNDFARMTIRTSSMRARLQSNIYTTREEAVAAVEQMEASRLRGEKTKLFID